MTSLKTNPTFKSLLSTQKDILTIQPLWVPLRKITRQDIFGTQKMRRKVQNILTNPDKIYFSIDDESYPYRGVKGKAIALIPEDTQKNLSTIQKINMK